MTAVKQILRPARSIGDTRREKAAARRAASGLPPKVEPAEKMKKCDDCRAPISKTEYHYGDGVCSNCRINNY